MTDRLTIDKSLAFTVCADHDKKQTVMKLYDFGKEVGEIRYDEKTHYSLLVSIIEAFKGRGCCDAIPNKPDPKTHPKEYGEWIKKEMANGKYWNRPYHDVYSSEYSDNK